MVLVQQSLEKRYVFVDPQLKEVKKVLIWDENDNTKFIQIRPKSFIIDFLLVAGWGAGWSSNTNNCMWRWWGWGWWVIQCCWYEFTDDMCVVIWQWGTYVSWLSAGNNWWNSCFWDIVAYWWGWWWADSDWCDWWSWGWAWHSTPAVINDWWQWVSGQWNSWWMVCCRWWWWGGWGAKCPWCPWVCQSLSISRGWDWWAGIWSDISWTLCYYAWWGWGWWACNSCSWEGWAWWWWPWRFCDWCNATYFGWWGGWTYCRCRHWWNWYQWVFIARYPSGCWYDITWWTKYTCWDYTIHCFTSDWTLTIN